jgi:hypothetical protein
MFVVEISSTGAEILFLMVPGAKECLLVKLLCGIGGDTSEVFALRFVVNARERLVAIVVECMPREYKFCGRKGCTTTFSLQPTRLMDL